MTFTVSNARMLEIVDYNDGEIRGKCLSGYENLRLSQIPWDTLRYRPQPDHKLVKASHTRRVIKLSYKRTDGDIEWVFAKRTRIRSLRKLLAHVFVPSKALREWRVGLRLRDLLIGTAQPLIFAEKRNRIFLKESFLVTRGIDNAQEFPVLLRSLRARKKWQALQEMASFLLFLHQRGFYHDDCNSTHVLVNSHNPRTSENNFFIIDLDNCRVLKKVSKMKVLNNIFQVFRSLPSNLIFKTDKLRVLKAYWGKDVDKKRLKRNIYYLNLLAKLKNGKKCF